jgi:tetratricopeptide (TPR) repeat protein
MTLEETLIMKKTVTLFILTFFVLMGCSAMLVPYTSDPSKKLDYAYSLIDTDRPLPAENLIDEALDIYQKKGDELGMAEAYHTYGNLYKTDVYYTFPRTSERRVKTKEEAVGYFQKALDLYKKNNDFIGAAKCQFGMGQVYWVVGKNAEACSVLDDSLVSYNKAKELDPSAKMPFRANAPEFSKIIQYTKEGVGCDKGETK